MKNSRNVTIFIIIILFIYSLFSKFYLQNLGINYIYSLNPLFFLSLALILKHTIVSPYKTKKYKKPIIQFVLITILCYAFIYLISGLFLNYGNNPYSNSLKGIILNLYSTGLVIVCREYIRYKLINNVFKKDHKMIFILIVIVFSIQDISIANLQNSINIYFLFKTIFGTVIPTIIRNILYTYIAIYTDCIAAIIYEILYYLLLWIPPVLPKTPWVFDAIINTVFPLILLLYCRYDITSQDKLHVYKLSTSTKPSGMIPLTMAIVLAIWFALGIFPLKPIGVASGSMKPNINIGDVVIIKKCTANDIEVNDIIEYKRKNFSVIHRVIEKYQVDGEIFFITKGDNNKTADRRSSQ